MRRKKWMIFGLVLLFLAAAGIGVYLGTPSARQEQKDGPVPVQSVAQLTGYADEMAARSRFLGLLMPGETVMVQLEGGREVSELLVAVGSAVEAGTPLAVYDNTSLLLEREQTALDMEQAKITISQLENQQASLRDAKDQAPDSEKESYDLQILDAENQLEQARYDLSLKEQELIRLDQQMSVTQVVSPCAGTVTQIGEDGRSVTIVSEGVYELTFSVSENELEEFQTGMEVTIRDREGEKSCRGTINRVEAGSPQNGLTDQGAARPSSYTVHGTVTEADGFFAGQHVYVETETGGAQETEEKESEILIPQGYLLALEKEPWVWAADQEGKLEKRNVTVGAFNDRLSAYEITAGLSVTDYLAWPMDSLKEGMEADFTE